MILTEQEKKQIEQEAAEKLPYPETKGGFLNLHIYADETVVDKCRQAYIAGATAERERAKGFCDDIKRFMETIPIDNGNVFFNGFDEYRLKIIELINKYNP